MYSIKSMLDYLKNEKGMSQRFVAKKIGVGETYLSNVKNKIKPNSEMVENALKELYYANGGK